MPVKTPLTAKSLEALGAERLAALLFEISAGDAVVKRRLRLELAGQESPRAMAGATRKRLVTIGRSGAFVDWQNFRDLINDLETQYRSIVGPLAKADPAEALDLCWQFLALANGLFERSDDGSGTLHGVFATAVASLRQIAAAARPDPRELAERIFDALLHNGYGQYDGLIAELTPALGHEGLDHLKQRMLAVQNEPIRKVPAAERRVVGWSSPSGPIYADNLENRARRGTAQRALGEIADAQGDVDGFIAQYEERIRKVPRIAAEIATRLLGAGRADDAWRFLEAAERAGPGELEWHDARIAGMDALGRPGDAQAAHWALFEQGLSAPHLRAYLKRLPDFEEVEAEQRALDLAAAHQNLLSALDFLASWPALDRAAALVVNRVRELNGNHYHVLAPAADALAGRYPLAATLILRAMIGFTLDHARASRYRHAAQHRRIARAWPRALPISAASCRMMPMSRSCAMPTGARRPSGRLSGRRADGGVRGMGHAPCQTPRGT